MNEIAPRRSRRLSDSVVVDAMRVNVRMIHQIRSIAEGRALVDPGERRVLFERCRRAVEGLPLEEDAKGALLDLFADTFRAGAASTINPMSVIKAFETLVRVGHVKVWTPPDAKEGAGARNVTINILARGAEPKAIEAEVIEAPKAIGGPPA